MRDCNNRHTIGIRVVSTGAWIALGAFFLTLQAWILIRWIADSGLHRLPPLKGATTNLAVLAGVFQALVVVAVLLYAIVLVRSSRRAGQVTLDTALWIGLFLTFWQNPLFNYHQLFVVFSRNHLNVTSWGPYIPGWHGPAPELQAEPVICVGGLGYGLLITWVWVQVWIVNKIKKFCPSWGFASVLLVSVPLGIVAEFLIEVPFILIGRTYAYPATIAPLTVFSGHWYQIGLAECLAIVVTIAVPGVILRRYAASSSVLAVFDTHSDGQPLRRSLARVLGAIGFANLCVLVFMLVNAALATRGGQIPGDMPDYLWPQAYD